MLYHYSDEGWKIGKGLAGEYRLGYHHIYGQDSLTHYNGHLTCLNWYNSSLVKKTKRTFEIEFAYDFLMVGLIFWAKIGSLYNTPNWYGIRIYNQTNYYWMSNVDLNCDPTEDSYNKWYHLNEEIPDLADSSAYCYSDVLIYFDPLIDSSLSFVVFRIKFFEIIYIHIFAN